MILEFAYNLKKDVSPTKVGAQKPSTKRNLDAASNMLLDDQLRC